MKQETSFQVLGVRIASPQDSVSQKITPIQKGNFLKARVIICSCNDHVRLLPPEPWSSSNHSLLGSRLPTLL